MTDGIREAGVLANGRVASVAVETSRQMLLSTNMRLRLEFDGQPGVAPSRVFFKTRREGMHRELGGSLKGLVSARAWPRHGCVRGRRPRTRPPAPPRRRRTGR